MDDEPPPLPPKQRAPGSPRYSKEEREAIRDEELAFRRHREEKDEKLVRSHSLMTPSHRQDKRKDVYRPHSFRPSGNQKVLPRPKSRNDTLTLQSIEKISPPNKPDSNNATNDLICFNSPEKVKENTNPIVDQIKNLNMMQQPTMQNNFGCLNKVPIGACKSMPSQNYGSNNNHLQQFPPCFFNPLTVNSISPNNIQFNQLSLKSQTQPNTPSPSAPPSINLSKIPRLPENQRSSPKSFYMKTNSKTMPVTSSTSLSGDLIDFGADSVDAHAVKPSYSSILDDFDPLHKEKNENANSYNLSASISSEARELLSYKKNLKDSSYYEQIDPFEYMQASAGSTRSDPVVDIYDGLGSPGAFTGNYFDIPPPLPPRPSPKNTRGNSNLQQESTIPQVENSYKVEYSDGIPRIKIRKLPSLVVDKEARAFWDHINKLRGEYGCEDHIGNPGLLHSPCLETASDLDLSVKLVVYHRNSDPALFTCNLNTSIEHVVMQAMVALELNGNYKDYILKVRGIDEYLSEESILADYEYVHLCVKHDKDVSFTLMLTNEAKKSFMRTADDDEAISRVEIGSLLSTGSEDAAHYNHLSIAIEAFDRELFKIKRSGFELLEGTPVQDLSSPMRSKPLRGIIRQICTLLGEWETVPLCGAIVCFIETCRMVQKNQGVLDGEDDFTGRQKMLCTGSSEDSLPSEELKEILLKSLNDIVLAIINFLSVYARALRVDFDVIQVDTVEQKESVQDISLAFDKMIVEIQGLHRLNIPKQYDEYFVEVQLYHGSYCVGLPAPSKSASSTEDKRFYPKIVFNEWLDLGMRINALPRESRLVFTIFGVTVIPAENKGEPPKYTREALGWASIQMFSFDGWLSQGNFLLVLWPMESDRRLPPAPYSYDHPQAHLAPLITIKVTDLKYKVFFPKIVPQVASPLDFKDLDISTQHQLLDIIERDIFTFNERTSVEDKEILWEKRHYLYKENSALAMVLLSSRSWDASSLPELHSLVLNWVSPTSSSDILHLFLPCFPDTVVRNKAVEWLCSLGSDELIVYLPQLVQAVKHEAWDTSKLICFLLERALTSPRLAHHLYWLLNQCLPLQTNMGGEQDILTDARYHRRLNLVTRTLMAICGKNMEGRLLRQEAVLRTLYEAALVIKNEKDSHRMRVLKHKLQLINENLEDCPTSLPLSPSLEVAGIDIEACSYYTSFTVPLRLVFLSSEVASHQIHTIFKVGDDLRQDMLVIQMIRLMDKLWLREGLDLKIVTFNIVPTGDKIGILELVRNSETLGKIHNECGLTGPFKDRVIADWLAKQNPSQLEYHRAVDNFTASCAGYCVATYILGICDRHNDNIMLKTSGHMFHIDFGKFLGDVQKFGNIKRDRTPIVLTADMAYVINGGDKPSDRFQDFVDLCCRAFNIIRSNGHLLLYLFALMASSGVPGVTIKAVKYVETALLQEKTNAEAGAFFAKVIQKSLDSWFTQVNFFIHSLAQLRFSGESQSSEALLSFVPHNYSLNEDGRIIKVRIVSYQKRYNPEKYYVYILKVSRQGQKDPTYLFRCYREFSEFHQKLCYLYPLADIQSLPKGVKIGRSEVKAVAEKRKFDIELFLGSLFNLADEVSHSRLVYTFFHPLLRDQEDTNIHLKKLKNKESRVSSDSFSSSTNVQGQVKLSFQYIRRELQIMVHHARNLARTPSSPEPSPYIKLYLLPDPAKRTKRKTKVVKKSCHPTYMEMITYRMSWDVICTKVLEVSVWSEDKFSDNIYLGSSYLKLSEYDCKSEMCEWLSLEHNITTAREHGLPMLS